jgi:Nucleotide-sugar transporter
MLSLKYISLGLLVLQNTALVLLMSFSRNQAGPMYCSSTAVAMMEVRAYSSSHLATLSPWYRVCNCSDLFCVVAAGRICTDNEGRHLLLGHLLCKY